MPVRSLTQSVLRWPTPEQVLQAARSWALEQRRLPLGPLEHLPLFCDALVLTSAEFELICAGFSERC
jgi:hypothetical protein